MGDLGAVLASTTVTFTPATYDATFPYTSALGSGITVSPDMAMRVAVVYACTTVIAETLATVPLHMYEREGEEGKKRARGHELDEVLDDQPNRYQTAVDFREMMTAFALNRGRGIAEQVEGASVSVRAAPTRRRLELKPLHPGLVTREITPEGVIRYRYQDPIQRRERILLAEELLVVSGRFGRSVLDYARDSFGAQLAAERYLANLLARGARPSGALTHQKTLSDTARTNLRTALDSYAQGGDNEGRPLLLEEGMTWQDIGLKNRDLEFVAIRQFSVAEGCRWYRVPLHKVQELLRATNNNIERQSIDYVQDSILPWAVRWEQSIRRDLITRPDRFFAEHNLEGLLRGDLKTRSEAYAIAIQWGWMTRNEVRQKENLNRIDGLDEPLTPLNMSSGDDAAGQGARTTRALRAGDGPKAEVVHYLRAMVRDGASRLVRKENARLTALATKTGGEGDDWSAGVEAFYAEHGQFVATVLKLPDEVAETYAAQRCAQVVAGGPAAIDEPEISAIAELTELALTRADVLRLPAEAQAA
jgi:HK97 family phage portal protein